MSASFFTHPLTPSLTKQGRGICPFPVSSKRCGTRSALWERVRVRASFA